MIFTAAIDSTISLNISFNEPKYSFDESDEPVVVKLVLSGAPADDITVQIISEDNTATGK